MQFPLIGVQGQPTQTTGAQSQAGQAPTATYQNRTYTIIKYSSLTAIAVASFFIGSLSVPIAVLGIALSVKHIIHILNSHDRQLGAEKAMRVFQIVIWMALSLSAVGLGLGTFRLIQGTLGLYHSVSVVPSTLQAFLACRQITFTLGFIYPVSQSIYRVANRIDDFVRQSNSFQIMVSSVRLNLPSLLARTPAGDYAIDNLIPVLPFVPSSIIKSSFERAAPTLSHDQIATLQSARADIFTYEYLSHHLTLDQLQHLADRQLKSPLTQEDLTTIQSDLRSWKQLLQTLQARYRSVDQSALDQTELQTMHDTMQSIVVKLSDYTQRLARLKQMANSLPNDLQSMAHLPLYNPMQIIRDLASSPTFTAIYPQVTVNPGSTCLREELIAFSNILTAKLQPQEEAEDLEEEAYMVLSSRAGLRLCDFKVLVSSLELPPDDNAIQIISEKLAELGVNNLRDLYRHGILIKNQICYRDEVVSVLKAFLKGELKAPQEEKSDLAPSQAAAATQSTAPQPAVTQVATPSSLPSIRDQTLSTARLKLYRLINHIYHYVVTTGLLGIQLIQAPIALPVGFIYGVIAQRQGHHNYLTRLSNLLTPYRNWQVSPDYLGMTLTERARDFYSRSIFTNIMLNFGNLGGFLGGMNHASAFLMYTQRSALFRS